MWALVAALAGALLATVSPAAVVIDPVPPIAPGITVGIRKFGQAPALAPAGTRAARIQSMQPVPGGSGRSAMVDTAGYVEMVGPGGGTPSVYLDLRTLPGFTNAPDAAQTGLMSIAFHPNFSGAADQPGYGKLYVVSTATAGSGTARYAGNGPTSHHDVVTEISIANPRDAVPQVAGTREVLRVAQPYRDHGPGTIAFNPTVGSTDPDYGKLYIGLGDGGGIGDPDANAQDLTSPFGKILRIDPLAGGSAAYGVPAGNADKAVDGQLPEIWAYGLRNPQQFSWDPASGGMLVTDIGMSQIEEVNVGVRGGNYGWPGREGTFAHPSGSDFVTDDAKIGPSLDPVAQFDHEEIFRSGRYGLAAISGVFAYDGSIPELRGMAVLGELVSGRIFYFPLDGIGMGGPVPLSELFLTLDGLPTSMHALESRGNRIDLRLGTDGAGELYLLSKSSGDIWRLVAGSVPEPGTWAQMLLGFVLVGAGMRRGRIVIPA